MTVFDIAMDTLFADPNLAVDAGYFPHDSTGYMVRIIIRAPDVYQKIGNSTIESPSHLLEVKIADCPNLLQGEQFVVNQVAYTVQGQPRRDEQQLIWQADVYAS